MKRRSETCEKIFHCFKSIPQQLAHVHKTARSYPHDMTINKFVDDFHSVLLNSIADLLEILERKKEDGTYYFHLLIAPSYTPNFG